MNEWIHLSNEAMTIPQNQKGKLLVGITPIASAGGSVTKGMYIFDVNVCYQKDDTTSDPECNDGNKNDKYDATSKIYVRIV